MMRTVILPLLTLVFLNSNAESTGYSGAEIYAQTCAMCHSAGVAGAPRLGQVGDWELRSQHRRAELLLSVLRGKGSMPPKGGNASLTADDANAALEYMLAKSARR
jgi:cytochrome c5